MENDIAKLTAEYFSRQESGESLSVADVCDHKPSLESALADSINNNELFDRLFEPRCPTADFPSVADTLSRHPLLRNTQTLSKEDLEKVIVASELMKGEEFKASKATNAAQLVEHLGNKLTDFQAKQLTTGNIERFLLGNFLILDKIGDGGMGEVFKARQLSVGREVALKVLPEGVKESKTAVDRFLQEAKALGQLRNEKIVSIHDTGEVNGTYYLAMDLVSGADLAAEINRGGPIAPEEAASYIRQAAEGLRYAHQKEVLHRDIKPANLIVDDGKLVIVDFGLAQLPRARQLNEADRLTQYGKPVGTLTFMAPEQITNSGDVDFKADIYSLGCTFFYLLTGKILHGDDLVKNLSAKQSGDTPDLAVHLPDVHESLRCVIAKMVAAAPEDRYRSYDDLLSDLESLEKGTASEPKPSGPAAPAGSGVGESFPSQPVQQHAPPLGDPSMPVNYEKPLEGGSLEGGYSARIWLLIPFAALLLAVMVTGAIGIGAFVYSSAQPAVADRAPELGGVPVEGGFNFGGSTLIQNRDLNMFAGEKGVTRLGFRETSIGDDGLEQIRALKSLKTLDLTNTQVTDHGVGFLVELPLLKDLKLVGTKVTDQGLLTLASRDSLTHLQLTGSNVTPYGWGRLRGLNLVDLHLGVQTPPSAEQWSALADFNNLDGLHLAGPGLTNDCVDHLQQLPVVTLGLRHSNISNVGIEKIADSVATGGFAGLKNLDLYKSQKITKDAVPHLIRLARAASRITRINIEDTGIASEGEMELKTALPGILLE